MVGFRKVICFLFESKNLLRCGYLRVSSRWSVLVKVFCFKYETKRALPFHLFCFHLIYLDERALPF